MPSTCLSSRCTRPQHEKQSLSSRLRKTRALATEARRRKYHHGPHSDLSQTPSTCLSSRCTRQQHGSKAWILCSLRRRTRALRTAARRRQESGDRHSGLSQTPSTCSSSRCTRPLQGSKRSLCSRQRKARALATVAMLRQDYCAPDSVPSQTSSTCSSSRCTSPQHGSIKLNL